MLKRLSAALARDTAARCQGNFLLGDVDMAEDDWQRSTAANAHVTEITPLLASVLPEKSITHFFGAHTAVGKNIFPRLAGSLNSSMVCATPAIPASDIVWNLPFL